MKLKTTEPILAPELRLRAAHPADAQAVSQLILEVCTADGDPTVATTAEELQRFWTGKDFNLETDAWVVETSGGRVVGYQEFYSRFGHAALQGDGYVHPDFQNQGIGTVMLRRLDARAREELRLADPGLRVYMRNGMAMTDREAHTLHENEGYKPIRYSWRMEITLKAPPDAPHWPAGIELRPFVLDDHNRTVFEADEEAFSDHWGHTPSTFERWQHHLTGRPDFDPSLWFIAWAGDQVAGFSLCRYRMGIGWVGSLGVRRPWRKQGLGLALLQHSFREFYRREQAVVGLGVDAANPTGATRLYKKAGMHVANEYVIYEKEFRPGREPNGDE
jgi:mycothiol synthase